MSRRLPVYLLVDTSGSMRGEPIAAANSGLQAMIAALKQDPFALETVYLSVLTFDSEVKEVLPLTEIDAVVLPELQTPESGPTHIGKALEVLIRKVKSEVLRNSDVQKGDWRPLMFLITDGKPSDIMMYKEMAQKIKECHFASVVACAAGPDAKTEPLKLLTDKVFALATMDGNTFAQFFKWVSQSIAQGSTAGSTTSSMRLPPPPAEVQVVF